MPTAERHGRVLQVNVSPGGVPKLPVEQACVRRMGLDGDRHRGDRVHGGPLRAVCLFGNEVIEALRAEGHPIFPGSVGENITTEGLVISDLPAGTRLAIGEALLEVTTPSMPCDNIVESFSDRKSGRISILTHPHDSRMYARVLREGIVRAGDAIRVLPPDPASDATAQVELFAIEAVERFAHVSLWRAARAAGFDVEIVDDGELAIGSSTALPGRPFNLALGLRPLPSYLPLVLERSVATGRPTWFRFPSPPWPGAEPAERLVIHTAEPMAVAEARPSDGVVVREARADEVDAWAGGPTGGGGAHAGAWPSILRELGRARGHHPFVALVDGQVVGGALLAARGRIGLLTAAAVAPEWRGRGIQRALIGARAARATELGCEVVAIETSTDNEASLRNIRRTGFRELARREVYGFDPGIHGDAEIAHATAAVAGWEPDGLPSTVPE
ncbi:MAG TPA: GNAT family N-acetyltransferase [Candidatus Limnocylindrales bacterium]|nr:GNAT family N-acetyltransferase [Candidatus Limnocylindrales bacterium]